MRIALIVAFFVVPLLLPLLVKWWKMRHWGLPVRVVVDSKDPNLDDIAGYLAEIARRLDERPERMRVVFDGRNAQKRAISLDVEGDRSLRVGVSGHRPKRVDLRGRWVADHPVPVSLRRAVFYIDPVDGNRFRVMTSIPFPVPSVLYVLCSLAATWGMVRLSPEILALVVGFAVGCALASSSPRFREMLSPLDRRPKTDAG